MSSDARILTLYHCPGACSQVAVCAFEKSGIPYALRLIDVASGEQHGPDYAEITALQRVPALHVDGTLLTENSAIIMLINELAPGSGLFPRHDEPLARAQRVEALSFCGATLHPIVRGIFAPGRFTDGDGAPVRSRAIALAEKSFAFAEDRVARAGGWWFGEWSIIDVYLHWIVSTAERGGYDVTCFPALAGLRARLSSHASFRRMLQIEKDADKALNAARECRGIAD